MDNRLIILYLLEGVKRGRRRVDQPATGRAGAERVEQREQEANPLKELEPL